MKGVSKLSSKTVGEPAFFGNKIVDKTNTSALTVQVAGNHYKNLAIQPIEYIHANNLGYCEANIVKYISRWRNKGGKQDLEKVKHYVDLLIQLEKL